jgi:hypothetical protein
MNNESVRGWHLWFFIGGIAFVIIGLLAHETALAVVAGAMAVYAGVMYVWRSRRGRRNE